MSVSLGASAVATRDLNCLYSLWHASREVTPGVTPTTVLHHHDCVGPRNVRGNLYQYEKLSGIWYRPWHARLSKIIRVNIGKPRLQRDLIIANIITEIEVKIRWVTLRSFSQSLGSIRVGNARIG